MRFPEELNTALRDGRLVVFAGAGVSMGKPASLPSFAKLTDTIAKHAGKTYKQSDSEDQFLGNLKDGGTDVHRLAAEILGKEDLEPTALHRDLLRLYARLADVKIVTTNFDVLLERAAEDLFADSPPEVFRAPALPLGRDFQGIIHIHGSVAHPHQMVLTDQDFGRAYLTDGWALRFLIDMFSTYSVLFIGYRHEDTIMKYLGRALPPSNMGRYALIGETDGNSAHWRALGIKPITFSQSNPEDYSYLNEGIGRHANLVQYNALDWQREITEIARRPPPIDEDSISLIQHMLEREFTTRFFTDAADSPDWIGWLDQRGHLNGLFADDDLNGPGRNLAYWLATRFAVSNADDLFTLIGRHGMKLNPTFWSWIARQVGHPEADFPNAAILARWVYILLFTLPTDQLLSVGTDALLLTQIAEKCSKYGVHDATLLIYDAMVADRVIVMPSHPYGNSHGITTTTSISVSADEYDINELWENSLSHNLNRLSEPLLHGTTIRIQERHSKFKAWGQATCSYSEDSIYRSAVEPHEQDNTRSHAAPLIDVARDCLEWLVENRPRVAAAWIEQHIASEPPLLRRLAIHTLAARTDLTADQKLTWLLANYDVNETTAHHELFVFVASVYPEAGAESRTALIQAVGAYEWPDPESQDKDLQAACHRFSWFDWICEVDPDCLVAQQARLSVLTQYPDFRPSDHPEFTRWTETWSGSGSPWSVEELTAKPASEWLEPLLTYDPPHLGRVDRYGMLQTVENAVQSDKNWGLSLADAISASEEWETDLWRPLIDGWIGSELGDEQADRVLEYLSELIWQEAYAKQIASALTKLIGTSSISQSPELLSRANAIANQLWTIANRMDSEQLENIQGWLSVAINSVSGKLAQFWVQSLAASNRERDRHDQTLPAMYKSAFDQMMEADNASGTFARTILASQLHFIADNDQEWAIENLLPLLDSEHPEFRAAWDGFLFWGRITPQISGHLSQLFIQAAPVLLHELSEELVGRFLEFYLTLFGIFEIEDSDEWITKLLVIDVETLPTRFARAIRRHLQHRSDQQQQDWWDSWLKRYWEGRIKGVPTRLGESESTVMFSWLPYLTGVFREAVDMAEETPIDSATLRGAFMYSVKKAGLIESCPDDVARLVIYMTQGDIRSYQRWVSDGSWMEGLLSAVNDPALKQQLENAKLKLGL